MKSMLFAPILFLAFTGLPARAARIVSEPVPASTRRGTREPESLQAGAAGHEAAPASLLSTNESANETGARGDLPVCASWMRGNGRYAMMASNGCEYVHRHFMFTDGEPTRRGPLKYPCTGFYYVSFWSRWRREGWQCVDDGKGKCKVAGPCKFGKNW
mmetsp:Transcript_48668/g.150784  ORF Transcript_48668/g.150784 Transcript_48668/m.150784 type:complete len:158 (-) Transcript_48668:78-551(-)